MTTGPWTAGGWTVRRHTYGRLTLQYAGGGSGSISLTRTTTYTDRDPETQVVAGAGSLDAAEPTVVVDAEVPFGVKVTGITYTAGATSVYVDPEPRRWSVLSDPLTGCSVSVVGAELGDVTYHSETEVSWLNVVVNGDPVVNSKPEQVPSEALSFYTVSRADVDTVARLAGARRALLLRHPDEGTDDTWLVLAGDRAVSRIIRRSGEAWRRHDWTVQRLGRVPGAQTADTVADLESFFGPGATWADVEAAFPAGTVADLATGVFRSERQVVL